MEKIRNILERSNNIKKSTYIWNSLNATISACQSALILIIMARTNSIYDVGVFSIGYAVANLMLYIGQYGIRKFQSSDIDEKYQFSDYYAMRIITCGMMMVASLIYCTYGVIFKDYKMDKFLIIVLLCVLKCIQAFADVLHGRMQQLERLDVAAKASTIRVVFETLVYIFMLIVTQNLLIATMSCVFASICVLIMTSLNVAFNYCTFKLNFNKHKLKWLFIEGVPLFASQFLNMYVINAPKYAIDTYLSERIQAYYNIIFMPAFAVGILSNFIFNPILTFYAQIWADKKIKEFKKLVNRQIIIIAGLSMVGIAVAYTIGIAMLSFIFGINLNSYKLELCVVMIGGGMATYATFFSTILTIIRYQKSLLICYGIAAVTARIFSGYFVKNYELIGAAIMYTILMCILAVVFFIVLLPKLRRETL